ncbi:SRPBCC family protein [Parapusillimonas granuli]|uniref:SRPBCC family protein n=1 Tax=Parapusillimonas granuli TaxID=380911 RepID=A0A853FZW8_9BURK|nr:SRPBCC family protein [Parapusillimonas granuli]MBB5213522.1 hypothetical protein [Parapusillimonas granuli]MEB2398615.1 SRPBCC family protein [Alcaligenaceae bacterium]NYT48360.1 SRPBCC family protein [Parapusillimonas granuli]
MQAILDKVYPMPCHAGTAWQFLQDIEGVAGCMPGASITERIDDQHYKGAVSVRVGPATMSFKGQITVLDVDAATQTLRLSGKGTDSTGTSGASMDLVATVRATGDTCELIGKSTITLNGKAAAFGGRMMDTVSEQILKQFTANFAERVQALQAQADTAANGGDTPGPAAPATAPGRRAGRKANELNGLALLWAVVADWFRRLFSRKPV